MIKIRQAVIVEGKYDKIRLSNIIDGLIITTDGFGIFKNKDKQRFIKKLADERGIIILTDSDSAGFLIRSKLCSLASKDKITNVYVPGIAGKERRKSERSKEGLLGVEGVDDKIIIDAFIRAGVACNEGNAAESAESERKNRREITKIDLYELGLCGKDNSAALREKLLLKLDFPKYLSTNALIDALNIFLSYDEFEEIISQIKYDGKSDTV